MREGSVIAPPIVPSGRGDRLAEGRSPVAPMRADGSTRLTSAIIALAATGLLVVAWVLQPSADGLGTHRQLGLPACGWIASADLPCPTCGMTTAFSHAAHGDLLSSFRAQPLGMMLALGTAIVAVAGAWTACTSSMLAPFLGAMLGPRLGWTLGILLLVAWGWKILDHKGLLL
jgi:hypothetical protein